jgi:RNA polymerase sigma-70 factor, ECF subfamily
MFEKELEQDKSGPEHWVDEYGDYLFRYARKHINQIQTAEDLVQETFLAALKGSGKFQGRSSRKTWLVGILKHKIMDHYRYKGREITLSGLESKCEYMDSIFSKNGMYLKPPSDWGQDPESAFEKKEFWVVLRECIANLPENLLAVFQLKMMEERKSEEVCESLGIKPNNLWVIMHRSRTRIKNCMDAHWFSKGGGKSC